MLVFSITIFAVSYIWLSRSTPHTSDFTYINLAHQIKVVNIIIAILQRKTKGYDN